MEQSQCSSERFLLSDIENVVFQELKKELRLLDSLYGDIQKEEQELKKIGQRAEKKKLLLEQKRQALKGEKMRMYEEYAAGSLALDDYKAKKKEADRRISETEEQLSLLDGETKQQSAVPEVVKAAVGQASGFLKEKHLTASMVSAFIENVYVYDGRHIEVHFKYEQSIQDAAKVLGLK